MKVRLVVGLAGLVSISTENKILMKIDLSAVGNPELQLLFFPLIHCNIISSLSNTYIIISSGVSLK